MRIIITLWLQRALRINMHHWNLPPRQRHADPLAAVASGGINGRP